MKPGSTFKLMLSLLALFTLALALATAPIEETPTESDDGVYRLGNPAPDQVTTTAAP
ncbi:hypothetical protein FA13DRAFT_1730460 [Coprinellus micaceus]|uniref:Uncharacterized protein n=1 Tax=Coprinellus micaceus TaxID=71717 RepID=A0A4Y7TGY2_COPMI|nr:hypothetical protein FA13DRAFT_1730460 [Coprinellus micaceus]